MLSKKLSRIRNKLFLSVSLITVLSTAIPEIKASSLQQDEISNSASQPTYKYPKVEPKEWRSIIERFNEGDFEAQEIIKEQGIFMPTSVFKNLNSEKFDNPEKLLKTSPTASYLILSKRPTNLTPEEIKRIVEYEEKNNSQNPFAIGYCYKRGLGVERDIGKAIDWFTRAADQGFVMAQYELGNLYYYVNEVDQNYYQAVQWFKKAADQNLADAQLILGVCYQSGLGVITNSSKAMEWFVKSEQNGQPSSPTFIIKLLSPWNDESSLPADAQTAASNFFSEVENSIIEPITFLRHQNDPTFEDNISASSVLFENYDSLMQTFDLLNDVFHRLDQPGFMMRNFQNPHVLESITTEIEDLPLTASFIDPFTGKKFISLGRENVQASLNLMKFCQAISDKKQEIEDNEKLQKKVFNAWLKKITLLQGDPIEDTEKQKKTIKTYNKNAKKARINQKAFSALLNLPKDFFDEIARLQSVRHQQHQQQRPDFYKNA